MCLATSSTARVCNGEPSLAVVIRPSSVAVITILKTATPDQKRERDLELLAELDNFTGRAMLVRMLRAHRLPELEKHFRENVLDQLERIATDPHFRRSFRNGLSVVVFFSDVFSPPIPPRMRTAIGLTIVYAIAAIPCCFFGSCPIATPAS